MENNLRKDLKNMTLDELKGWFLEIGEKSFRGQQVFEALWKGIDNIKSIKGLPGILRNHLDKSVYIDCLDILEFQESKIDGTRKYLLRLKDGLAIEAVFMKYHHGNSLCISSQAGCRMGCLFCASTIGGLQRNLTGGEMADQILQIQKHTGEKIHNVVVMGTGEPFDNYFELKRFIEIVTDSKGIGLGQRRITVSTCGIIKGIFDMARDFPQINLAISLHGARNDIRDRIMPINKKHDVKSLIEASDKYFEITGRRVTFEYILIEGVNDSKEAINDLISLLSGRNCHVNLIPFNTVDERGLKATNSNKCKSIVNYLENNGIRATMRREMGDDIDGACGQLRLKKNI